MSAFGWKEMTVKKQRTTELDNNMVRLVQRLNSLSGVRTFGSCGGHANPGPSQWREGTFYVKFDLNLNKPGRKTLAYLAFFFNDYCHLPPKSLDVRLLPYAQEGTLCWVIEGQADPEEIADMLCGSACQEDVAQ